MTLVRKPFFDLDWPSWMTSRAPFDQMDGWLDLGNDSSIRVEEFDSEKHHVIRAEAPGIDPDKDVDLTISDGVLRLMVHRQKQSKTGDARHYRSEFNYGSFTRVIVLPPGCAEGDIAATYEDGILEVKVPINGAKAREKRIPIARH